MVDVVFAQCLLQSRVCWREEGGVGKCNEICCFVTLIDVVCTVVCVVFVVGFAFCCMCGQVDIP